MLLLLGTLIAIALFGLLWRYGDRECNDAEFWGILCTIVSVVIFIVELIVIMFSYTFADADRYALEQRYESLLCKCETEQIRDEFGIVNKEYIDEVQAWNEEITRYKIYQRNPVIGAFIPNIYDDFETIDLNTIEYRSGGEEQ